MRNSRYLIKLGKLFSLRQKYYNFERFEDFEKAVRRLRFKDMDRAMEHEKQHLAVIKKYGYTPNFRAMFNEYRIFGLRVARDYFYRLTFKGKIPSEQLREIALAPDFPSTTDLDSASGRVR